MSSEVLSLPEVTTNFSSGYSQRSLQLNKLRSIRIYGESISANEVVMDAALPGLWAVIVRYKPKDVFSMDGIGVWS